MRRKVPFVHGLVGDYPGSVDQTSSGDGPSCFERNEKEALYIFLLRGQFRTEIKTVTAVWICDNVVFTVLAKE